MAVTLRLQLAGIKKEVCLWDNGQRRFYCLAFYNKLVKLEGHD
jgi:hypothetical protein